MIDYEILLLLDPDLAEEPRRRSSRACVTLIEKGGGSFTRHDDWGKRKLAYEIDKKADGNYHLLLFSAPAGDARRDHARAEDRRQRHAPPCDTSSAREVPAEPLPVGAPASHDAVIDDLAEEDED